MVDPTAIKNVRIGKRRYFTIVVEWYTGKQLTEKYLNKESMNKKTREKVTKIFAILAIAAIVLSTLASGLFLFI
jgi:hypothetical protein